MLRQTLEEKDRARNSNLHKDCKLLFQSNFAVVRALRMQEFDLITVCILSVTCINPALESAFSREKWPLAVELDDLVFLRRVLSTHTFHSS